MAQPNPRTLIGRHHVAAVTDWGGNAGGAVAYRHFYASGLIAAGCDVVTVQASQKAAPVTHPWVLESA